MASFEIMDHFEIHKNDIFLKKADEYIPKLKEEIIKASPVEGTARNLKKGDAVVFDLGNHYVGYAGLQLGYSGSHPDAPVFLKIRFGERIGEFEDDSDDYDGWISRGWIQEEWIHVDTLPSAVELKRRYAFRYIRIEVLDTSQKFSLNIESVSVRAVSAVSMEDIRLTDHGDELLNKICRVSAYTLKECMQDVFEDGPKRDRRLWLGDLRLQAKVNYITFKDYDLVKRCLYLFGGIPFNDDRISACLFTEPEYESDDTFLLDYSLFFVVALSEYYDETKDLETVRDLYPIAARQIKNAEKDLDNNGIIVDKGDAFWCFLDWSKGLNKQAGAQAVFIYAIGYALKLARLLEDETEIGFLEDLRERLVIAAKKHLWDSAKGLFVSGSDRQISMASQIWMILAGFLSADEASVLLDRLSAQSDVIGMVTPYMYNYYIEALIYARKKEEALKEIKHIWGGMIEHGADTFWELYNPENTKESPYGSDMVNSYCHAWSCTPVLLLEKIFEETL